MEKRSNVKFGEAIAVLLMMLVVMGVGVIGFRISPQIPVLVVIALVILWARIRHFSWDDIHKGITEGVSTGIVPIFIFILIGVLISVWIGYRDYSVLNGSRIPYAQCSVVCTISLSGVCVDWNFYWECFYHHFHCWHCAVWDGDYDES